MTIRIGEWTYTYEHLGSGVYRIMGEHDRQEENGVPFAGWHQMGRVRAESPEQIEAALVNAESQSWPYVEKPRA